MISAVAAFSLILAGCGCSKQQNAETGQGQNAPQVASTNSQGGQPQNQENKISASLKDLLGMGKTVKCTATTASDKFTTTGTTYVSGDKMRSDTTSQAGDAPQTNSHIIIADGWMYMWSEGASTGMKLNINEMKQNSPPGTENANPGSPSASNQLDNKTDFNCSSWTADESVFAIPQNVTFTDQSAVLNNLKNNVPPASGNACAVCDSIPNAAAKAQCKANCAN